MKVKKLSGKVQDARQIPTLFDNENITYHPINIEKNSTQESVQTLPLSSPYLARTLSSTTL